jgi:hypothetical protein
MRDGEVRTGMEVTGVWRRRCPAASYGARGSRVRDVTVQESSLSAVGAATARYMRARIAGGAAA